MIVVTGGAGFIGSNLLAGLEARWPDRLVVCDWLGCEGEKWRNIAKRGLYDIVAPENLFTWLERHKAEVKIICHMGAISATTVTDGDKVMDNNFRLSRDLWLWCAEHHVRLIYASSAATYGDGSAGFADHETQEALAKLRPLNLYGYSKHLFDRWIAEQTARGVKGPPQCVGLKFFNVYGPNEYHKGGMRSVVHQVYPYAARGEAFSLFKSYHPGYPDGGQLRDFVWIGDVVDIMLWLGEHPDVKGLFNVGSGTARSFADLSAAVYRALGKEPLIAFRDMPEELRGKYQYFTEAPMQKLRNAGYSAPMTPLEDGVRHYVQDYLTQPDCYA